MTGLPISLLHYFHLSWAWPGWLSPGKKRLTFLACQWDGFARILYFFALFLTLLLGSNALRFFRIPFSISAWAYSFPLAAITIATFEMSGKTHGAFYGFMAGVLLFVLTTIILLLAYRTLQAAKEKKICLPEG